MQFVKKIPGENKERTKELLLFRYSNFVFASNINHIDDGQWNMAFFTLTCI